MPPTTLSCSRTTDSTAALQCSYAAVSPAGPPPMMTTLVSSAAGMTRLLESIEEIRARQIRPKFDGAEIHRHQGVAQLRGREAQHKAGCRTIERAHQAAGAAHAVAGP